MSRRKYLIKIYQTCILCDGKGRRTHVEVACGYENIGSSTMKKCGFCNGTGKEEITPSNKDFKKLYIKTLKRNIGRLNLELYDANNIVNNIRKDMKKYCKEFDKVVNKK